MALSAKRINGIALAAGAGGLELGLELAIPEYRTVCWCERDAYAASTLVTRMEDKTLDDAPIWSDLTTFNGAEWNKKVDILTAGYPCQPFSASGKRLGEKDPRHLWPHVRKILAETKAPVLWAENVFGHVSLGFENVRTDLQNMGYTVKAGIFSAAEVGASHIRKRLFILAYSHNQAIRALARYLHQEQKACCGKRQISAGNTLCGKSMDVSVPDGNGQTTGLFPPHPDEFEKWEEYLMLNPSLQPAVAGSHDGLAHKVDRYRLTGNGVCTLAATYAFTTLVLDADTENPL